METKVAPKKRTSALGTLVLGLVVLAFASKALSTAPGSGGRRPPETPRPRYLANDPCPEGTHLNKLAAPTWHRVVERKGKSETRKLRLRCKDWRGITLHIVLDGDHPDSQTVIDCIGNVIHHGDLTDTLGVAVRNQTYQLNLPSVGPRASVSVIATEIGDITGVLLSHGATFGDCA